MPDDAMYMPLHVGKAVHPDVDLGEAFVADNTGDNISDLNNYYSELTGLLLAVEEQAHAIQGARALSSSFRDTECCNTAGQAGSFR